MTLDTQLLTMLFMVLSGFYLGIALETFRRLSPLWKGNLLLVYFLEVSFWLSQTFILYYVLYRVNTGELRLYVLLAVLFGFSIYQFFAASMYKKILEYIITWTIFIYQFLSNVVQLLVIAPIKWFVIVMIAVITFILQLFWRGAFILVKALGLVISWVFLFIYWLFPKSIQKKANNIAGLYSIIKNRCMKGLNYLKRR